MKKIAMIAMFFGFVGAVHADPQKATGQSEIQYQSSVEQETQTAYNGNCVPPHCGYLRPENEESGLIETKPTDEPIIADADSLKLVDDPLCNTDPYSCFHLADHDATVVQENMQIAIPILIWIINQL
ncbi:hypothetical protein [Thioalkalivibrio sp. HK1]|uniref:hypothetical protein n=1 Tax=Thioalkalivibrio sp. HK1 TaxID=1469245 RepID=UPI0012DD40D9|nr:hypothetical protein [Thioalkalivibrio sp. HK1]